ncbi:MAG: hypothetical protein CMH30_07190 [Micavibrio sp.]|nr:hypothetical protein [Micavibrio sp.]|tara:strand:- start:570 stop:2693 length:2124 start_codon:yes stop_codon:yes gene_type:complete
MSGSALFEKLKQEGYLSSRSSEDDRFDPSSLSHILNELKKMDSDAIYSRFIPSVSQYEVLKKKYGGRDKVTIDEDHPEYIRHVTPFMRISGEGAFFIIHTYGWDEGDNGQPVRCNISTLAYHPDAQLVIKAMLGEIDPRDQMPWSLQKIQNDAGYEEYTRPKKIETSLPYRTIPENMMDVDEQLDAFERNIYDTDMHDRIIVRSHEETNLSEAEWYNRNVLYYKRPSKRVDSDEKLYDIFMMSSGGRSDKRGFDKKNKWVHVLAFWQVLPHICVARGVPESDITQAVKRDFNIAVGHLINGADPYHEYKLIKKMKRHHKNTRKVAKMRNSKKETLTPREVLRALLLNWHSEKGTDIRASKIAMRAFRKAGSKVGGKAGIKVLRSFLTNPRMILLYGAAVTTYFSGKHAVDANGEPITVDLSAFWSEAKPVLLVSVPFLLWGAYEALERHVGEVPQSIHTDAYRRLAFVGPRMNPDHGRYAIKTDVLEDARFAMDKEVHHSDLQEPVPDDIAKALWDQQVKMQDYSSLKIPDGSIVEGGFIGKDRFVFAEGSQGYRRLFIPEINTTFMWYEPCDKIEGAAADSPHLREKFFGENIDTVFMIQNRGVSERRYTKNGALENPVYIETRMDRVAFRRVLETIAKDSYARKPQSETKKFDHMSFEEGALRPAMKFRRSWRHLGLRKREVFDEKGTYSGEMPKEIIDRLDLKQ